MTEHEDSLLEFLTPDGVEDEGFRITDDSTAAWAVGKIKKLQDEIAGIKATAELNHQRIDQWALKESQRAQGSIARLTELLKPYAMKCLDGKNTRTHKVWNGSMSFRKGSVSYDRDDAKLLTFVKENASDYIVTTEKVNWAEYKKTLKPVADGKLVTEDGEIVEGVTYTQGDDVFTVKPLDTEE